MSGPYEILGADNTDLVNQLFQDVYIILRDYVVARYKVKYPNLSKEAIGRSDYCDEASQAVTITAHKLGLLASREFHDGHTFTSFSPLGVLPNPDDLIMCLTWGQFNPASYWMHIRRKTDKVGYFGRRLGIEEYVGPEIYSDFYSPESTVWRSITHTTLANYPECPLWLKTTPEELATQSFPIGEVPRSDFSEYMWDEMDLRTS